MEDESSSKAVTLLPATHSILQAMNTPPPQPSSAGNGTTAAAVDCVTPTSSLKTNTALHFTSTTPEASPQARPHSSATYVGTTTNAASRESDSNEEPLFQHPPAVSTPSPMSLPRGAAPQGMRPWCAVSATPPSAYLGYGGGGGVGVGSLFPSSALPADLASTPSSQSIAVGRDLSNRYPTAATTKHRSTGFATGRTAMTSTYVDSSSSESISASGLAAGERAGGRGGGGGGGGVTAHRTLFRSMASPTSGAMPGSPLGGPSRWGQRLLGEDSGTAVAPVTPMTPALAGEAVLVREPPTPAKQRRTIHTGASAAYFDAGGLNFGPRLSSTAATAAGTTHAFSSQSMSAAAAAAVAGGHRGVRGGGDGGGDASPLKLSARAVAPPRIQPPPIAMGGTTTTSPSLAHATTPVSGGTFTTAPSLTFKFHKREGSRKRSADVLSQFSALDLDETPATPYGQTVMNGRFASAGGGVGGVAFPSQPSASMAALRGNNSSSNNNNNGVGPMSPLLAGYATPVTLSQQIGGSNTFSQMLLHPSQDVLDMSQADTECSNFLARRIVNDYNEVRLLGRGSFGTVSLYKEISSGEYVAVKMSPPLRAPDMERRYRRERSVMGLVRGMPHVVQLSAAWEEGRVPRMYLQLEYCPGGSLAALASAKQARNEPWAEEEVKVFLAHMSIALDAMHRANIAHVDFKPDNVLIDKDGAYKLSDFGCSVLLDDRGRPRPETQNGYGTASSPSRVAPHLPPQQRGGVQCENGFVSTATARTDTAESATGASMAEFHWNEGNETSTASVDEGDCRYLCADMLNEKRHFKAGDMFSLGMSLYELMSGQPLPRNGDQFLALRRQVPAEMLLRRGYSTALVRLVSALLHSDPTQRPTARQVLQYLRPSAAELRLLADASAMQQWTTSAESFDQCLQGEQRQQHEDNKRSESAADLRATTATLRCVSALMEGSCWLLNTTQKDVHHALAATELESGDEEAEQHRRQELQQRSRRYPPVPVQRGHGGAPLEPDMDELPMSPIMREEACTPTTLNY